MLRSLVGQAFPSEDPGVDNFWVPTLKIYSKSILIFDKLEVFLISKVNSCFLMVLASVQ